MASLLALNFLKKLRKILAVLYFCLKVTFDKLGGTNQYEYKDYLIRGLAFSCGRILTSCTAFTSAYREHITHIKVKDGNPVLKHF